VTPGYDDELTRIALAAKGGDRDAAAEFVRRTQYDLGRFLRALGVTDVEDLGQETYLRALKSLPGFDARSSAKTWLFAVARNTVADHIRRLARRPRVVPFETWSEHDAADRYQSGPRLDDAAAARDLLRGLAPDRREAFALTQVLGLSYAEAAEICECPIGTIRSRVARAREDLIAANADAGKRHRPAAI
jgi:RNA polymerase sigma-70 factor (ECF subfamily)